MESPFAMFDNVKFDKETATARSNRARGAMKLWQIVEVALALAAVSWCSARAPAVARSTGACLSDFSAFLSNHHVAFLIGNSIILLIFVLCRQSDGGTAPARRDLYDVYVKYSEAARVMPPPQQCEEAAPPPELGGDKHIVVVCADEAAESSQCDDVAAAIEKAARQIRKFQRNRLEMTMREVSVRPELRRSETVNSRNSKSLEAAPMENLSNEEFRRRADAFIDTFKRTAKLEGNESFQSQFLMHYYYDLKG